MKLDKRKFNASVSKAYLAVCFCILAILLQVLMIPYENWIPSNITGPRLRMLEGVLAVCLVLSIAILIGFVLTMIRYYTITLCLAKQTDFSELSVQCVKEVSVFYMSDTGAKMYLEWLKREHIISKED